MEYKQPQKIWILFSLYKQDDDRLPINWATSVFDSKELALARKKQIEDAREDIKEVFIQENSIQTAEFYPDLINA